MHFALNSYICSFGPKLQPMENTITIPRITATNESGPTVYVYVGDKTYTYAVTLKKGKKCVPSFIRLS